MDYTVQGILQDRILEWVAFLQGTFPIQDGTQVTLQVDSLPAEPPGKPKNTGRGIPGTVEPGGLLSMESHRVGQD